MREAHSTQPIAGFILGGGQSSRMGVHKGRLEIDGVAVIVRTARVVEMVAGSACVVGGVELYREFGLRVISDDWPGAGPLGGIATALRSSRAEWNLIVACDLPYLTQAWLAFLLQRARASDADAVVPMNERGAEPLCAVYGARCEAAIRDALQGGTRKVIDGLARIRPEYLEPAEWKSFDSEGLLFKNMNTPADYEEAKARLVARAKS
jgi:molybdenum cofactor guanylyltransferase